MAKQELVGCIFCSEKGSGEHINSIVSIKEQVESYFNSYKAKRANKFIAYFQNFTNTYDSVENLKLKYDSALIDDRIVALAVATRPDCIDEDIAKLADFLQTKGLSLREARLNQPELAKIFYYFRCCML